MSRMGNKAGRNDSCPCGSRKKYKKCCGAKPRQSSRGAMIFGAVVIAVVAGGLFATYAGFNEDASSSAGPGKVWSPEHGHYH